MVRSNIITITVSEKPAAPPTYSITLSADKTSCYVGDTVNFTATVTANGSPASGISVSLYSDGSLIGTATTDSYGKAYFHVTMNYPGTYNFYAEV